MQLRHRRPRTARSHRVSGDRVSARRAARISGRRHPRGTHGLHVETSPRVAADEYPGRPGHTSGTRAVRCCASRCCVTARRSASLAVRRVEVRAVHRPADRAAGDVRGPGRHRHRERPAVRGAGAAQRRASGEQPPGHRGAGAADGDGRGAAGDRLVPDRASVSRSTRWSTERCTRLTKPTARTSRGMDGRRATIILAHTWPSAVGVTMSRRPEQSVERAVLRAAHDPQSSRPPEEQLARFPEHDAARRGTWALATTPLMREGEVIGSMMIARDRPARVHRTEIALPGDLRGPGGDRHRERPPVRGSSRKRTASLPRRASTSRSSWRTCPTSCGRR